MAMTSPAPVIAPAERIYRGKITRPERWETWIPNKGDILVCTPPKCGTTWTQTMLAMLVHGGADLPVRLPVLSPWVDADLGVPATEVAAALAAQKGRRVVKTHAPADGFPIWEGVTVIAVYRHPLDVFFSLRNHTANRRVVDDDDMLTWPVARSIRAYVSNPSDHNDVTEDNLMNLAMHYANTVLSGRLPDLKLFHYSDMVRDARCTVEALAAAAGIDANPGVIDAVTKATAFGAMKAKAVDYAPVGGTGFWKSDENFFESASSNKWDGRLAEDELALYRQRLEQLIPDAPARNWLESGSGQHSIT
ncbi:MAG: sulfotransferase domain-containing protein [Tabrizicola sp.]|uniref:sulfotransferase domain-containing protein n=1 Tax=Tabrizicola sp. TaxID=2005166 RepID=UPI00273539B3|nr:sulfotransferase domain-containing protein [Tabrizicola sp.]MDP3261921.1 sulfotransferase domain-containing protein [Tabrizicola sp.]MDP3649981.1 sulfotransferase domain-containing protein [Paracoccaceae bacterium]MDZ4066170.1 sulfotransferase domain-containing protein [Tabrizicola sp.]